MNPLAVYVHIPFCVRVCGYCDFNAYAGMDDLKGAYAEAVATEIAAWAPMFGGPHRDLDRVRGRHAR